MFIQIDFDFGFCSERARQNILSGLNEFVILSKQPVAHLLHDQRMVLGQLFHLTVANNVAARIADVRNAEPAAGNVGGSAGCPHANVLRIALRRLEDHLIGHFQTEAKPIRFRGQTLIGNLSGVSCFDQLVEVFRDAADGHTARNFSRLMASHAVSHDQESALRIHPDGIFIVFAGLSLIRQSCSLYR
jgi:hypothetical protein